MLSHPDDDPMGIRYQFENFLTADDVMYPIILVKDVALENPEALQKLNGTFSDLGIEEDIIGMISKKGFNKSTNLDFITDADLRERFIERFASLNNMFESQPLIRLLLPKEQAALSNITSHN